MQGGCLCHWWIVIDLYSVVFIIIIIIILVFSRTRN